MNPVKLSKFLSLVLRHKPETIGVTLDDNGWVEVDELLLAMNAAGRTVSSEQLEHVIANNDKQRFVIRDGRIRASQGHSIGVDLGLADAVPPDTLFHGTATRFRDSILADGLRLMNRDHVHLSADIDTAIAVGRWYGRPLLFTVAAARMVKDGRHFFLSENGVWLTGAVPATYLEELNHGA
ncbi:MAG: RNA 2'-phosphotransferase [Pseudomonadota bacterium]